MQKARREERVEDMFGNKANGRTKEKIMKAIMLSDQPQFASSFDGLDFVRLPYPRGSADWGRNYWSSHCGDVTVIVWERGDDVHDWRVQFQTW